MNSPYALKSQAERNRRKAMLSKPHMAPLEAFTERLRSARGSSEAIPSFDPLDGGCQARVLFLLEAPGPKARDSGFISRNNPDPTAKNMLQLLEEAGIPRRDTVLWNIVPWYLGDSTRIRAARGSDVAEGLECLHELLDLLPNLEEVVLVGLKAQRIEDWLHDDTKLRVSKTFHPSNRVFARWPEKRRDILGALKGVAFRLSSRST
jgi:hypothetical protein